jgi:hypothetical protein
MPEAPALLPGAALSPSAPMLAEMLAIANLLGPVVLRIFLTFVPEGRVYGRRLAFVSVRTIKRHHHHLFANCMVKCHEDVPRHIWGLFQALGIQYRWILIRGALGFVFVTTADLAIDDAKENAWMALHEHERDLLEDTMYRCLVSRWSEFSDAIVVFDANGPAQLLCAQKVWKTLLAAFPLKA